MGVSGYVEAVPSMWSRVHVGDPGQDLEGGEHTDAGHSSGRAGG